MVALAAFALGGVASPARAQTFPAFTGLVVDGANLLPADRKATLQAKLEAFQKTTQRQLVVAVIPDLQGYAVEDYGYRLGRSWGVGLKDADNGVILIVAPKEHKVRIEVGRRLEPFLTDAISSVIVRDRIVPAFKANDMPGGIDAGTDAIIAQLSLPDEQAKAQAAKAATEFDRTHKRSSSGDGLPLGLIFWGFVVLFVILAMRRGRSGNAGGPWGQRRYKSNDGGHGWIWLWAASEILNSSSRGGGGGGGFLGGGSNGGGGSDGSWGGGGFTGGGGGDFGGGGASGDW
ncbi:TPM domain-containing protein [Sphingomonas sp. BIUV-7]|uniref:TPM domain-containing protein n=1 Tax=Sphingomonas natans TaxID=3063330 RepID=A0ABT8YAQ5_9SPHN|nr:TPM domain-containing protein [Sphingomonas sp. BIUV-7]MDO6414735.1 TPM domain-containing protein [Sphingomonas sp. BIUV-7]